MKFAAAQSPIRLGTRSRNSRKGPASIQNSEAIAAYSSDCPGQCEVFWIARQGPSCAIQNVPASSTQKLRANSGPHTARKRRITSDARTRVSPSTDTSRATRLVDVLFKAEFYHVHSRVPLRQSSRRSRHRRAMTGRRGPIIHPLLANSFGPIKQLLRGLPAVLRDHHDAGVELLL